MQSVLRNLLTDEWQKADPAAWADRRAGIRAAFIDLLGEGPTEYSPFDLQWHGEERRDGLTLRKLSFAVEPDDRIPAYLVAPDDLRAPAPAVLCLHGTTVDARDACLGRGARPGGSDGLAIHLARRGFVTLAPDHFNAGERLKPGVRSLPGDILPGGERLQAAGSGGQVRGPLSLLRSFVRHVSPRPVLCMAGGDAHRDRAAAAVGRRIVACLDE